MAAPTEKYQASLATLRDLDDAELYALADELASLKDHPGFAKLESLMGAAREQLTGELLNGATKSQADYARHAGYLAGMSQWRTSVESVLKVAAERRDGAEMRAIIERMEKEMQASEVEPDGFTPAT